MRCFERSRRDREKKRDRHVTGVTCHITRVTLSLPRTEQNRYRPETHVLGARDVVTLRTSMLHDECRPLSSGLRLRPLQILDEARLELWMVGLGKVEGGGEGGVTF